MRIVIFLLLFTCSQLACALPGLRGVNYDPVHSPDYERARAANDRAGMIAAINRDLEKLFLVQTQYHYPKVNLLKTFFARFYSNGPGQQVFINFADIIYAWNAAHPNNQIKLALGVYQFRPQIDACRDEATCVTWTREQLNVAVASANMYPTMIDRIIVGNENIHDGAPDAINIRKRLVQDVLSIKSQLNNKNIKVGTAQISNTVLDMLRTTKYTAITNAVDFIGANVYPYWGGVAYGNSAKMAFYNYWKVINVIRGTKEVICTEEGWPTAGPTNGNAIPNPAYAKDYFRWWYFRESLYAPTAYYFALFDKLPNDPELQKWGIYNADRSKKFLGP